jgi:hypothetical protein
LCNLSDHIKIHQITSVSGGPFATNKIACSVYI